MERSMLEGRIWPRDMCSGVMLMEEVVERRESVRGRRERELVEVETVTVIFC